MNTPPPAMPKITSADTGCWLDGAYGWHNTYRVCEFAMAYGWLSDQPEELAALRKTITLYRDDKSHGMGDGEESDVFDVMQEASQDATEYLQSITEEGYEFTWDCGELFLVSSEEAKMFS